MSDYGLKISKEGVDVKEAADDELLISSKFNMFKIADSGTFSISLTSAEVSKSHTISHGFSYPPVHFCFLNDSGVKKMIPSVKPLTLAAQVEFDVYVTTSNFVTVVSFTGDSADFPSSATYDFSYLIMADSITTPYY